MPLGGGPDRRVLSRDPWVLPPPLPRSAARAAGLPATGAFMALAMAAPARCGAARLAMARCSPPALSGGGALAAFLSVEGHANLAQLLSVCCRLPPFACDPSWVAGEGRVEPVLGPPVRGGQCRLASDFCWGLRWAGPCLGKGLPDHPADYQTLQP